MTIKAIYDNNRGALQNVRLELTTADLKELWRALALLEALPTECGKCGCPELYPTYRAQPHEYYEITCKACGAEVKFGTHYNEAKTLFFDERQEWRIPPQRQVSAPAPGGHAWQNATPAKPKAKPNRPPVTTPEDEFPSGEDLPF